MKASEKLAKATREALDGSSEVRAIIERAVDHIFENMDEFEAKYAGTIRRFEGMGIDHTTALAMTVTIAAKAKALTDIAKAL